MKGTPVIFLILVSLIPLFSCSHSKSKESRIPLPVEFRDITVHGELFKRAMKNFDRLESDYYQPRSLFDEKQPTASQEWLADMEGRTILGLVLQARATHREPVYLDEFIGMLPSRFNEKGYFGLIQGDTVNEQQLSGHGWLLRGLCEYYLWKKDERVKTYVQDIIRNLALPTRGRHNVYPIVPEDRIAHVGEMSGTSQNVMNNWLLSSDIGCDFIFLDGLVQAYGLFPSPELGELIDEMIARFLQMDLISIKAQTHATLTGMRALIRYYEITGNETLLAEVIKRYRLYREQGMTENYENYNWFCRPEWTEPCAIIDSYLLAVQLWQHTQNSKYLEDAHLIYYNAICHTQRDNGGFGCDNCPGPADLLLKIKTYEAYWCCTMRGGEGLARAIQYAYFTEGNNIYVPFFHNNNASMNVAEKSLGIKETTSYPFGTKANFVVGPKSGSSKAVIHLFAPTWTSNHQVFVNGKEINFSIKNGFVTFPLNVKHETSISYSFDMSSRIREAINPLNTRNGSFALVYGPLMLGYEGKNEISFTCKPEINRLDETHWNVKENDKSYELSSIYHLLDPEIKEPDYFKQVLFLAGDSVQF